MKVSGFDASDYETRQVFYNSKDGTKIPMFIVHKKVSIYLPILSTSDVRLANCQTFILLLLLYTWRIVNFLFCSQHFIIAVKLADYQTCSTQYSLTNKFQIFVEYETPEFQQMSPGLTRQSIGTCDSSGPNLCATLESNMLQCQFYGIRGFSLFYFQGAKIGPSPVCPTKK